MLRIWMLLFKIGCERKTTKILKEYDALTLWQGKPITPTATKITQGETVYIRLHGPDENYKGNYDEAFLQKLATKKKAMQSNKQTVYCYFNSTMGSALKNLQMLNGFLMTK